MVLSTLGVHPSNPSGFDGWTASEKSILMAAIHKEIDAIANGTSEDLSSLVPREVPVYIKPKNIKPDHATMSGYQTVSSERSSDANGVLREKVIHKSPAELYAMAFGIERSDLPKIDTFRMEIRHELIHTLCMNAVEIYEMLTEGVVEYLTEGNVPGSKRFAGKWNAKRFQGTCGLRTDNNTQIALIGNTIQQNFVHDLTRIMAMNAFSVTTKDTLWAMCKSLHEHTTSEGVYATFDDFRDQVHAHLPPKKADTLLKQPLFQPMQPGEHSFLLPQDDPIRTVLAQSMSVHPNPKYQVVNPTTGISEYRQFILGHMPTTVSYQVQTKQGQGGHIAVNHKGNAQINQRQMSSLLQTQGITVKRNDITSIVCTVRGLRETIQK